MRRLPFALALAGVCLPLAAHALQEQVTRERLCELSTHVVLAEVTDVETRWTDDGKLGRWAHLAILDSVKGETDGLDVWLPGGSDGDISLTVEDVPNLMMEAQYLLFIGPGATGRLEVYGGEAHVVRILEGRGRSGSMSRADALQTVEVCRGK